MQDSMVNLAISKPDTTPTRMRPIKDFLPSFFKIKKRVGRGSSFRVPFDQKSSAEMENVNYDNDIFAKTAAFPFGSLRNKRTTGSLSVHNLNSNFHKINTHE